MDAVISEGLCPKCSFPRVEGPECPRCGVIYAKVRGNTPLPLTVGARSAVADRTPAEEPGWAEGDPAPAPASPAPASPAPASAPAPAPAASSVAGAPSVPPWRGATPRPESTATPPLPRPIPSPLPLLPDEDGQPADPVREGEVALRPATVHEDTDPWFPRHPGRGMPAPPPASSGEAAGSEPRPPAVVVRRPPHPLQPAAGRASARQVALAARTEEALLAGLSRCLGAGQLSGEALSCCAKAGPPADRACAALTTALLDGEPLSVALGRACLLRPAGESTLAQAAEEQGALAAALAEIVRQRGRWAQRRRSMLAVMTWPVVLLLATLIATALPVLLAAGLRAGLLAVVPGLILLGLLVFYPLLLQRLLRVGGLANLLRQAGLQVPLLGGWLRRVEQARSCRLLARLLEEQIAPATALGLVRAGALHEAWRDRLLQAQALVRTGKTLAAALSGRVPPPLALALVTGEGSGTLADALRSWADEEDVALDRQLVVGTRLLAYAALLAGAGLSMATLLAQPLATPDLLELLGSDLPPEVKELLR